MVNLTINGIPVQAEEHMTILTAAASAGITIPTLCYLKDINEIGACRVCVVEIEGVERLQAACNATVSEGMAVYTNSPKVREARRINVELILSQHVDHCVTCVRSGNCELQKLCHEYGIEDETRFEGVRNEYEIDNSAVHMYRDNGKCILCRRCVAVCDKLQSVAVIGANERGFKTHIGSAFEADLAEVPCVSCGQCITVCPTGALAERDDTQKVIAALNDPSKHVIVQTAPAVRVGLGEEFGLPVGTIVTGKMVAALKRLGFDGVFDTNFSADLTITTARRKISRSSRPARPAGSNLPNTIIRICSPTSPPANLRKGCSAPSPRRTMPKRWASTRKTSSSSASCRARRRNSKHSAWITPQWKAWPTLTSC